MIPRYTAKEMAAIWLPAAFAPSRVIESEGTVTWNADTGSLTVDNTRPTSDGITYTVESVVPLFTPDELRAALKKGLGNDFPTLIEIPVGELPSPWHLMHLPRVRG